MSRVKRGVTKQARHKKILRLARGHYSVRHRLYRRARESVLHSLMYSYIHRRERKGDFRRLWILRIGAASRARGLSYNTFMHGLKENGITLNRKMLADMSINDPEAFSELVNKIQQPLAVA
mgnify:CR=1 FL=1